MAIDGQVLGYFLVKPITFPLLDMSSSPDAKEGECATTIFVNERWLVWLSSQFASRDNPWKWWRSAETGGPFRG